MEYVSMTMDDFKDICKICHLEGGNYIMRQTLKKETASFEEFFEGSVMSVVEIKLT